MPKLLNVGPQTTIYCVDPNGRIRYHRTRPNVTHRAISYQGGGRYGLSAWGVANGWAMLESLYAADPDEEIREKGWQVWLDYNDHAKKSPMRAGDPFPDEWLPAEVLRRRENNPRDKPKPFPVPARGNAQSPGKKIGRPKGDK